MAKAFTSPGASGGVPRGSALGMIETFGLAAAIEAADAMLKSAEVVLVRQQRTVPAMVTHFVMGETAAVQAAVDAGAAAAARVGRIVGSHVIPSPSDDVWKKLVGIDPKQAPIARTASSPTKAAAVAKKNAAGAAKTKPAASPKKTATPASAASDYDTMTVRALRTIARDRDDERLTGRAIARASKDELVAFLRASDAGR